MPFALFATQEQLEEKGLFFRNHATVFRSSHLIKWTQYLSNFFSQYSLHENAVTSCKCKCKLRAWIYLHIVSLHL